MEKQQVWDIFIIVILMIVFTVIIKWSILFFFLGNEALKFVGYVTLTLIVCLIFLPEDGPQHIVSAFFGLGGCYKPNIALVTLLYFNKVGKKITYSGGLSYI